MKKIMLWQRMVHYGASVIGGFWAGYTVFNHADILANAQTGNLIRMVVSSLDGRLMLVGWMALCFLVYCGGNVFYVLVRRRTRVSMKIVSLICSSAAVILAGAVSFVRNDFIACFPIVFAAPVQWNAFKIANGNSSSTIFSSNNVRQAAMLTTNYLLGKDKGIAAKARFYWLTLLSFHLGVALSVGMSLLFGVSAIWFCFVPILLTALTYGVYQNEKLRVAALVRTK